MSVTRFLPNVTMEQVYGPLRRKEFTPCELRQRVRAMLDLLHDRHGGWAPYKFLGDLATELPWMDVPVDVSLEVLSIAIEILKEHNDG